MVGFRESFLSFLRVASHSTFGYFSVRMIWLSLFRNLRRTPDSGVVIVVDGGVRDFFVLGSLHSGILGTVVDGGYFPF